MGQTLWIYANGFVRARHTGDAGRAFVPANYTMAHRHEYANNTCKLKCKWWYVNIRNRTNIEHVFQSNIVIQKHNFSIVSTNEKFYHDNKISKDIVESLMSPAIFTLMTVLLYKCLMYSSKSWGLVEPLD